MKGGGERLSALDSFFLHLESPRTPMHTGSVAIFEAGPLTDRHGRLRIEEIRRDVGRRLDLVPKLRRRVAFGLLGTVPMWVDDPSFDLSRHVRQIALPAPGGESELAEICAELMAVCLEREHPLWELWFVEGLAGGRIAVVEKLHHALADGLGGVELATVLLDIQPRPASVPRAAHEWSAVPGPRRGAQTARALVSLGTAPARAAGAGATLLGRPLRVTRAAARFVDGCATIVTPGLLAPRSSLNVQIGHGRRFALVRQSLDEILTVERRFGVTLNDVLLTAVAGGVRSLYEARGEASDSGSLQVLVPVGADHRGDHRLGNRVSAMLPRIPVGRAGPVTRLRSVAYETTRCKRHHQTAVTDGLLVLLGILPQATMAAASRLVHHQLLVNVVVTNVPGTSFPLYARGARMLEAFPIVPLAGNLSVGVAALSYDGQLTVGLLADRDRFEDLDVLAHGMHKTFGELVRAARGRRASNRNESPTVPRAVGGIETRVEGAST